MERLDLAHVRDFSRRLVAGTTVRSDALASLNAFADHRQQQASVTPPELADEWLPVVHVGIGNLKRFLPGTFHGVSGDYLQEYIDEYVYRFNGCKL